MIDPYEMKLEKTIPITQYSNMRLIHRYASSVYAILGNSIAQINFESSFIDKINVSHQSINAKYLKIGDKQGIYISDEVSIREYDLWQQKCTNHIRPFSLTSTFTKQFSSDGSKLLYCKYHKNHSKYSISLYNPEKCISKIVKLCDTPPQKVLLCDRLNVLYQEENNYKQIDLQTLKCRTLQPIDTVVYDSYNYYTVNEGKVKAFCLKNMKEQYEFKYLQRINQIQEFGDMLLVGSNIGIQQFDIRNLDKPLKSTKIHSLIDFLFEPNIRLLFANDSDLLIYAF